MSQVKAAESFDKKNHMTTSVSQTTTASGVVSATAVIDQEIQIPRPANVTLADSDIYQPQKVKTKPTSWIAQIVRVKKSNNGIDALQFASLRFPIFLVQQELKFRPMVAIEMYLTDAGNLMVNGQSQVEQNKETGRFVLFLYLKSKSNDVILTHHRKDGSVQIEKFFILAPEAQEYELVNPWDAVRFSLGSAYVSYLQTGHSSYYAWSGLLGVRYTMPEKLNSWGINADAEMTMITFNSNQGDLAPQLANIKFEGVYFDQAKTIDPLRIHYLAGLTYLTMFSNGAPFGFKNLFVPDGGVRVRYVLSPKSDISSTFRLSLLDTKLKDLGFELELSRSVLLKNNHRAEIGMKFLEYVYHPDSDEETLRTKYMSLFLSYTL